jgi:thiol-disulfide isomerase/thioredoxin
MKLIRIAALFVGLIGVVFAAPGDGWMTDLAAAKAKAARERKPLLIEFTGSAWCPPCIALHKKVLTTPEFAAFGENVILVKLDYPPLADRAPEKVKANPELARLMAIKAEYEVPGFPTVFYYDASGKQRAKLTGYDGETIKEFLAKLNPAATAATPARE